MTLGFLLYGGAKGREPRVTRLGHDLRRELLMTSGKSSPVPKTHHLGRVSHGFFSNGVS